MKQKGSFSYHQKNLQLIFFILLLIILFINSEITSGTLIVKAENKKENWYAEKTQSKQSFPFLLQYNRSEVLYQNQILEADINIDYLRAHYITDKINVTIRMEKGKVSYWNHVYFHYERDMKSLNRSIEHIYPETDINKSLFRFKPIETDNNFNMSINIELIYNGSKIYSEYHKIWVIGEPEFIPGRDITDKKLVILIYLISSIIAIAVGFTILLINRYSKILRENKKGGGSYTAYN